MGGVVSYTPYIWYLGYRATHDKGVCGMKVLTTTKEVISGPLSVVSPLMMAEHIIEEEDRLFGSTMWHIGITFFLHWKQVDCSVCHFKCYLNHDSLSRSLNPSF